MTEPSPRRPDAESERPIWGEHPATPEAGFRSDDPRFDGNRPNGFPGPVPAELRFGFPVAGRPDSEAALRQYLLTRALGRSVMSTVQWSAIAILLLAAGCWLIGLKVLAVLIGIVALFVLLFRSLLSAIGRRLSGADRLGPVEPQVRRLVARTGRGLRRELRRAGLPGTPWAPLLILLRLMRPYRRRQTAQALARVDLNRVVPASQLDELHLLLQSVGRLGGSGTP
jgi:hypothetical protein